MCTHGTDTPFLSFFLSFYFSIISTLSLLRYFGAIVASYFIFPEQSVSNVIGMHENAAAPGHAASMATAEDMQHVVKYVDEFEKIR